MDMQPAEIIRFWENAGPEKWFAKDEAFDAAIRARFLGAHEAAARCEFADWASDAQGALALLLLLDQFPRNLFRNSAHAFATDGLARQIARAAVAQGFDRQVAEPLQAFFYLPFMHSELAEDQVLCAKLCDRPGLEDNHKFALVHLEIIERFGHFPHRNAIMGRVTTAEEQAFLDSGGFAG
ncbi:DUF924 family protein [Beijerinckia sp. 28-YEA-48]|uniref:DUF924 family protein n=1 Tax=unclassified Beijerinckia TaxID=2638183 RepID=UPI00089482FB|nr:uncharacterized protein (DUF924 family) [Beijerinckia sp. GAS462]SEB47834.1 Uncharacterized conserved protein, DUF924 family [Beijerinckia sp. 28-YEA-48]